MKRAIIGAAAVAALGAMAFSGTAQAQCYWTGLGNSCMTPPAYAYGPGDYYAPYTTQNWSEYYGAPYPDYKPPWVSSYPGPRPSSGAGW